MPFIRVAAVTDIPDGYGKLVEVGGRMLAVFNAGNGVFHATSALCPHEDGPLADGWLEGKAVVCPWHGFDFDLQTGRCLVDPDLSIAVHPVRVRGTDLEVEVP